MIFNTTTSMSIVLLSLAILLGIIAFRMFMRRLYIKHRYNPLKQRSPAMFTGFACSLLFVILAFGLTSDYEPPVIEIEASFDKLDMEVIPERTVREKKVKVKVVPENIDSIIFNDDIEIDTIVKNIEKVIEVDTPIDAIDTTAILDLPPARDPIPTPPPPPPPHTDEEDDIPFRVVEQMPRFPGCEHLSTKEERESCANQELLAYVYKRLKYPPIARENGIIGYVAVQFVVNQDGKISDAKIMKDIGAGCGQAVIDVVNSMNSMEEHWTPGKQRGRKVKVLFTLPVRFSLK